jgi:hypothetical protein
LANLASTPWQPKALHDAVPAGIEPAGPAFEVDAGIALRNSIRTAAEGNNWKDPVFDRDRPARRGRRNARSSAERHPFNHAGDWEGQRLPASMLRRRSSSGGAPRFARLAGAALLPVFTVRGGDRQTISVVIEPALAVPTDGKTDDALQSAAQAFGRLLERYVTRYPAEWRDWQRLELPASAEGRGDCL